MISFGIIYVPAICSCARPCIASVRSWSPTRPTQAGRRPLANDPRWRISEFGWRPWWRAVISAKPTFAVLHEPAARTLTQTKTCPCRDRKTMKTRKAKSFYGRHPGRQLTWIDGELWRDEDIEPGSNSERVRGDKIPTGLNFIVDAAGTRAASDDLDNEDIGRWLWFRATSFRPLLTGAAAVSLVQMDTGGVGLSGGRPTHFGINKLGQINVYAYELREAQVGAASLGGLQHRARRRCVGRAVGVPNAGTARNTMAPEKAMPQLMASLGH